MSNDWKCDPELQQPPAVACSDLLGRNVGLFRGGEMPEEDGYYMLDASRATQIKAPSGFVQVVAHWNFGKPWPWCYWLPERKHKQPPRCGCPLRFMSGCVWTGPLRPNNQ